MGKDIKEIGMKIKYKEKLYKNLGGKWEEKK
jgi:hypothetical protein